MQKNQPQETMFGSFYSMIYNVFWIDDDLCVVVCQDTFGNVISVSSSDEH